MHVPIFIRSINIVPYNLYSNQLGLHSFYAEYNNNNLLKGLAENYAKCRLAVKFIQIAPMCNLNWQTDLSWIRNVVLCF